MDCYNIEKNYDVNYQKNYKFDYEPKISIIVPTYNTNKVFLIDMIESVKDQTYFNWELCIADGSDKENNIRVILKEYEKKNEKIKIKLLEKNKGISGNSYEALKLASGEYIGLLDHDDILLQNALFEIVETINKDKNIDIVYTDEDRISEDGEKRFNPHFKPDWSPDTLRSYNYICHFVVFKKSLLSDIEGYFNSKYDGSQDYDLILRLTEIAKSIIHIPKVLYCWRAHKKSFSSSYIGKKQAIKAAKEALKDHLDRVGLNGNVHDGMFLTSYKINYKIKGNPKVSIIIPSKEPLKDFKRCINSILEKTRYGNYEIVVIENNSHIQKKMDYYKILEKENNITIVKWDCEFSYSAINNFGVKYATGEFLILLNNNTEIITPNWIEEMIQFAQREDVGIVGAKLYYKNNTIQHGGVIIGLGGTVGNSHKYFNKLSPGYMGRLKVVQNLSAVTGASLMVRKDIYEKVGKLDEKFEVAFSDVDFCLRVRTLNKLVVWNPYVELYSHESRRIDLEYDPEKIKLFEGDIERFVDKWGSFLEKGDPYYNNNLTLKKEDFSLK